MVTAALVILGASSGHAQNAAGMQDFLHRPAKGKLNQPGGARRLGGDIGTVFRTIGHVLHNPRCPQIGDPRPGGCRRSGSAALKDLADRQ